MRRFILASALTLLASSLALPALADVNIAPAFGNTVVGALPNGQKAWVWFRPDGGYTARLGDGLSAGRWSVRGDQVCLRQSRPVFIPFSLCTPAPAGGVGAVWTARAPGGETMVLTLVKGQVGG